MADRIYRIGMRAAAVLLLSAVAGCRDAAERAHGRVHRAGMAFSVEGLLAAAGAGAKDTVKSYLEAGMHVDAVDAAGETALLRAASQGRGDVVSLLLKRGANAEAVRASGESALHCAAANGDPATVKALLAAGADPATTDRSGASALLAAAAHGHAGAVRLLAEHPSDDLPKALHLAAGFGHTAVIDVLLHAGVSPDEPAADGRLPLEVAAAAGQEDAVKLLCRRGAGGADKAAVVAAGAGNDRLADWLRERAAASSPPEPAPTPASLAVSLPVSGTTGPAPDAPRLSGLRRPEWRFPGMDGLGEAMVLTSCPLREYPFVLVSVEKGHGSAVVALAGPPERRIGVTRGDPIPGTDLVVDGLRRRMLYANGKSGDLVDASTMTLKRPRDGWSFTAGVEAVSFSGERVAMIRFPETGEIFAGRAGDDFRFGSALLRLTATDKSSATIVNRLTNEKATLTVGPPTER